MKNLFVPYAIAKQLKEKGFNEPCLGTYLTEKSVREGKLYPAEKDVDVTPEYDEDGYENFVVIKNSDCKDVPQYMSAPTYQQVIDFFAENKIDILTYQVKPLESELIWVVTISDLRNIKVGKSEPIFMNHDFPDKPINHWENKYAGLNKAFDEVIKLI